MPSSNAARSANIRRSIRGRSFRYAGTISAATPSESAVCAVAGSTPIVELAACAIGGTQLSSPAIASTARTE